MGASTTSGMPSLPPLWGERGRKGKKKGAAARKVKRSKDDELNRRVMWRLEVHLPDRNPRYYGTCARCDGRIQALRLKWVPDRMVFGNLLQGYWACRGGCPKEE